MKRKEVLGLSLVVLVTFFLSELVIFMLSRESFIVISQVVFIIIVFISIFFSERSLIVNLFIGMIYLIYSAVKTAPSFSELIPAMVQFYVFIMMSIVISGIIRDIRYNERKYFSLLENTSRGICIYDTEKRVLSEKNNSFKYDADVIFDRLSEINPAFFELRSVGKSSTFEIDYEPVGSEKRDLLIFAEKLFESYVLFIVTDITERKREEENSQIVSALSHGLLLGSNIDAASSFTLNAARNISGTDGVGIYLFDEEKNSYALISSRNLPEAFEINHSTISPESGFGQIIAEGYSVLTNEETLEVRGLNGNENSERRDVAVVPFYLTNKPVGCIFAISELGRSFSDNSKFSFESVSHIFGSALKRIHAEKEILVAKTNLESLFDSVDDFIFVSDMDGNVLHANSVVPEKLGYNIHSLKKINIADVHGITEYESFIDELEELIEGEEYSKSFELTGKHGNKIFVEMKAVLGKWGEDDAVFVIDRDVTLRKKHEDEIRSRDAILDAVSLVADNFLGSGTWKDSIDESLERLGEAADVVSICLFETKHVHEGIFRPESVYQWVNEDYNYTLDTEKIMNLSFFRDWAVYRGSDIKSGITEVIERDSVGTEDQKIFEDLSMQTILAVPLIVEDYFRGFLCLIEGMKREWSPVETEAVVIAGDIISSAIGRTESDEIFRNPVERSLLGVYIIQDFVFQYANPKFAEMFGYSNEEILGNVGVLDLIHPDYRESIIKEALKAEAVLLRTGEVQSPDHHFELKTIRKNGDVIDVEIYGSFMLYRGDLAFVGMALDITARKRAERELEETTERLNLVLQGADLGIWDLNLKDDHMSYNERLFSMLGYTSEDYRDGGMSFGDIIHPDDVAGKEELLKAHLEGSSPYYEAEYRMRAKDGEWHWISAKGQVVERDNAGNPVRIAGTHFDITEKRSSEERIRHLNRVMKAVRNVNELIVRESNITRLIERASELLIETRGYFDAWVILTDSYGSYLSSAGSGDIRTVREIIEETKTGNPPKILTDALRTPEIITIPHPANEVEGELLCRRLDYGESIFGVIIISIPSELSNDSEELGLIEELAGDIAFAIHDIILQKERESYQEQILKSLEEKTVLLQEVHHRVKNNLQIISGLMKMQSRSVDDPEAKESLLRCENRIMALAMVHEALYRSEDLSEVSIKDHFPGLAQTLVDSLAFAEDMNLHLKTNVQNIYLPINIAIPCSLIINEVISNSIKYAFEGRDSGTIGLEFRREGENYYMMISDDGVGVPEDFDLDKSKSLGLKLVRRLATQQLRGSVEVMTNGGTSFIFRFPKIVD